MRRTLVLPFILVVGLLVGPVTGAAAAPPTCEGVAATIVGTSGPDTLTGTAGDDVIVGLDGSDTINSLGGDDIVCAGNDHDVVNTAAGNDRIHGGDGNDRLDAGAGFDIIHGDAGADVLHGRTENDDLFGGWGPDRLFGGGHDDSISDDRGKDHADGGPGTDTLHLTSPGVGVTVNLTAGEFTTVDGAETEAGIENVNGTPESDVLRGDAGPNALAGQPFGGPNQDRVYGGAGNDVVSGNQVWGGAGNDFLTAADEAMGGEGNDRLVNVAKAYGQTGSDLLIKLAGSPATQMAGYGGWGDDRFILRDGCDPEWPDCAENNIRFAGGDGTDRIQVVMDEEDTGPRGNEPYVFDLPEGTVTNTLSGLVVFINAFEEVVGSVNDDTIIGTDGANYLMGGVGNDTIDGGGGHYDVLAGGTRAFDNGSDALTGGDGDDLCYTSSPPGGTGPLDVIEGCETTTPVPAAQ